MKVFKYILLFLCLISISVMAWIYYPQYQINNMKKDKESTEVSTEIKSLSYIDYFREFDKEEIYHLALGDSVISGVGANPDENLVTQFSEELGMQTQKKVHQQNEGIKGITSTKLNELVQAGTYDELIKKSDIITINVGGNDILNVALAGDYASAFQVFDTLQKTFSLNLSDISDRVHQINPKATIVFLELYNPLHPEDDLYSLADPLLPKWNVHIYKIASEYPSSIVVETTKAINGNNPTYLSTDGVHPNGLGYTAIADLMLEEFKNKKKITSI